jgi:hypothetical protein
MWVSVAPRKIPTIHVSEEIAGLDHCPGRTVSLIQMNWLSLRNNRLKVETSGGLPITLKESVDSIPQMIKAKLEDVNMLPAGFRITRILTDYAPSRALVGTATPCFPNMTIILGSIVHRFGGAMI